MEFRTVKYSDDNKSYKFIEGHFNENLLFSFLTKRRNIFHVHLVDRTKTFFTIIVFVKEINNLY